MKRMTNYFATMVSVACPGLLAAQGGETPAPVPAFLLYFLLPWFIVGSLALLGVHVGLKMASKKVPGWSIVLLYGALGLGAFVMYLSYRDSGSFSPVLYWVAPLIISLVVLSLPVLKKH